MPCKGAKAPRREGGPEFAAVTIELNRGENDPQNVDYHATLLNAWKTVEGHALFENIASEEPLTMAQGGSLAPFNQNHFATALQGNDSLQSYTCGVNLAWVNHTWSATPGIPIRNAAVEAVASKTFQEPAALDLITVAVPSPTFEVKKHKGALLRVSPEEMTTAFILALARDVSKNVSNEILSKWRVAMVSTPCKFVVLPTPMDRYWKALQLREDISHTYNACHRSCYQRLHEVVRLVEAMKTRMLLSQVTTDRVEAEYRRNLRNMDMESTGAITHGFVKTALTVAKRMLSVPEIAAIMREADSKGPSTFNPWGTHSRLQAMIDKCQTTESLLWCCQALDFKASQNQLPGLSVMDIRGGTRGGSDNKGLFDLLHYKRSFKGCAADMGPLDFQWGAGGGGVDPERRVHEGAELRKLGCGGEVRRRHLAGGP